MQGQGVGIGMASQQGNGQLPGQLPRQVPWQVLGHGAGQATAGSSHMMASGGPGLGPGSSLTSGRGVASRGSLLSPAHGFGNLFNEEARDSLCRVSWHLVENAWLCMVHKCMSTC